MNEKASWNQTLLEKSHKRNTHLSCTIIGTIPKMHKERTQTNGLQDKKIDDDAQGLTS